MVAFQQLRQFRQKHSAQSSQSQASLLADSVSVLGELLGALTVDLVLENLLLQRRLEDVVSELISHSLSSRRMIVHVLEDVEEAFAGLFG